MNTIMRMTITAVLVLAVVGLAQAASIGLNVGGPYDFQYEYLESTDVAGADGVDQDNWNNFPYGKSSNLAAGTIKDADGNVVAGMSASQRPPAKPVA
jgi:hypothetical protein